MILHHRASFPASNGKMITAEIEAAALLRLKAAGTLSGAGFNGVFSPQESDFIFFFDSQYFQNFSSRIFRNRFKTSVVVSTDISMDKIHLASKMTIAGDFESSLGVSYNPLSGTMEVRIAKPSEDKMIFKVEKEITSPVLG